MSNCKQIPELRLADNPKGQKYHESHNSNFMKSVHLKLMKIIALNALTLACLHWHFYWEIWLTQKIRLLYYTKVLMFMYMLFYCLRLCLTESNIAAMSKFTYVVSGVWKSNPLILQIFWLESPYIRDAIRPQ